jgi:hypothetical protein
MTYQRRRFGLGKTSLPNPKEQSPIRRRRLPLGECLTCDRYGQHGPSHDPSSRCESGSRLHCTCDLCF